MSVEVLVGDLFNSKAQTLVNTVNTVGVMGKGIALQFKKRFPEMYEDYKRLCDEGLLKLGEPYLYKRLTPPYILNFPTKEHWEICRATRSHHTGAELLKTPLSRMGNNITGRASTRVRRRTPRLGRSRTNLVPPSG